MINTTFCQVDGGCLGGYTFLGASFLLTGFVSWPRVVDNLKLNNRVVFITGDDGAEFDFILVLR